MTYTTQDSLERLARFVFLLLLKRFSRIEDGEVERPEDPAGGLKRDPVRQRHVAKVEKLCEGPYPPFSITSASHGRESRAQGA